jgi:hypothetical protein
VRSVRWRTAKRVFPRAAWANLGVAARGANWPPGFRATLVPLGDSATFVERFTLSDDGGRLHYTITVTDADLFTMPTELKRSWVTARPGPQLLPFNCTV